MTSASIAESDATAIGTVVCVNDKGIKFEGAESWSNFSRFAVGLVAPSRGDVVSVTFDRQGFIRAIAPADGHSVAGISTASTSQATNGTPSAHAAVNSQKDRTITRLAVLKAAAEFSASKPQSSSADVLKIAASWERWVLRGDDPTDDLADAF